MSLWPTECSVNRGRLTITLILPLGPVTSRQEPHSAALFQAEPEKAVPYSPDGRLDIVVKEHIPPLRFPP